MKLLTVLLLLCSNLSAIENEWSLKGGLGINFQALSGEKFTEDDLFGLAANTAVGYRFTDFALTVASYGSIGRANNVYFKVGDELEAYADANFWLINFLFLPKYYTNINIFEKKQLYFSLGPGIAIQTFWPSSYTVIEGDLSDSDKITYETLGIYGTIGFEERTLFPEDHPTFFELLWGYNKSYRASLVNVSDEKTISVISTDSNSSIFNNFVLMLNFGLSFF
jgi:hypothetical protein